MFNILLVDCCNSSLWCCSCKGGDISDYSIYCCVSSSLIILCLTVRSVTGVHEMSKMSVNMSNRWEAVRPVSHFRDLWQWSGWRRGLSWSSHVEVDPRNFASFAWRTSNFQTAADHLHCRRRHSSPVHQSSSESFSFVPLAWICSFQHTFLLPPIYLTYAAHLSGLSNHSAITWAICFGLVQ